MAKEDFVWEIRHETWEGFPGNGLYDTVLYAKECGMSDYMDAFAVDGVLTWETILKGFFLLYEDGLATGLTCRARPVHSKDK
jgi:hypothetical protein